tara:strand:+ start:16502 stop:17365 length:864 start_codon:yes stop_codon:yes gene_type:complete
VADDGFIVRRVTSQDGLSLYVRDYPGPAGGADTPLLCLGGLTRNSKDFAGVAKFHSRQRRVICPDTRGRGFSEYDSNWRNYDPAVYIGDVRHILCALGIHGVVVLGTSMGGLMGMGMAAALPGALKGLVLNDVGPIVRRKDLDVIVDYMKSPPTLASWDDAGQHLKKWFDGVYPIASDDGWTRAARLSYVERADGIITFDWDPDLVKPILADDTETHDFWHLFTACGRIPVLTVRGAKSNILDVTQMDQMTVLHPNMRTVTVAGVGHAPGLAEPESVEALNGFLKQF